jgi:hypothetical protein
MTSSITEELCRVCQSGKYYYPATAHYNDGTSCVFCDRCGQSNLLASIGLDKYDLCMKCNFEILEFMHSKKSLSCATSATRMAQKKYRPKPPTYDTSSDDEDSDGGICLGIGETTRMAQKKYRPKPPTYDMSSDEESRESGGRSRMNQRMYRLKPPTYDTSSDDEDSDGGIRTRMAQKMYKPKPPTYDMSSEEKTVEQKNGTETIEPTSADKEDTKEQQNTTRLTQLVSIGEEVDKSSKPASDNKDMKKPKLGVRGRLGRALLKMTRCGV